VDPRLQGRPDAQVQEMMQALGIALLCASARPDDRPTMKDVAALLCGLRSDDGKVIAGSAGNRPDASKCVSPTKPSLSQSSSSANHST
jgi:tRNA A37 threonylcarbamoyladenosine synthetase subunit TsaC/SUA5/YrdC